MQVYVDSFLAHTDNMNAEQDEFERQLAENGANVPNNSTSTNYGTRTQRINFSVKISRVSNTYLCYLSCSRTHVAFTHIKT